MPGEEVPNRVAHGSSNVATWPPPLGGGIIDAAHARLPRSPLVDRPGPGTMTGLAVAVLVVAVVIGLALVPLGLPGLWVMVLGVIGFGWLTGFRSVGVGMIAIVLGLAAAGEVIEAWIGSA